MVQVRKKTSSAPKNVKNRLVVLDRDEGILGEPGLPEETDTWDESRRFRFES